MKKLHYKLVNYKMRIKLKNLIFKFKTMISFLRRLNNTENMKTNSLKKLKVMNNKFKSKNNT